MGFYVERRFGWDTHGLPVEHEIDKKLQIRGKEDVMKMGIPAYNAECRAIVMRYAEEWKKTVERMGRWIDFENDYKTLNPSFMESIWWAFATLFDKGLVYRGLRVMPYSTGCTTPLSNFEAGLDYRDVQDPAVTVAFPLVNDRKTSLLAWTTTPWTLPSNLALCVHPKFKYIKIVDETRQENFIIHENLLRTLYKDPKKAKYKKIGEFLGADMIGWRYVPLFEYFTDQVCSSTIPFSHIVPVSTFRRYLLKHSHCILSSKTRHLELWLTNMSPQLTVQVSSIKPLHSVTTITVLQLAMASLNRTKCLLAPSMIQDISRRKLPTLRGCI